MAIPLETNRREAILDAAAVVISRRGVDSARLVDIAAEAGVSLGLVQHYFHRRDRLLSEVFQHELDRIRSSADTFVDPNSDPLSRLVEYLALCIPIGTDHATCQVGPRWGFWIELWSKAHRDPSVAAHVVGIYSVFMQPMIQAANDGVDSGALRPRSTVADAIKRMSALVDGLAIQTITGIITNDHMFDLMIDALSMEFGLDDGQRRQAEAYSRHAKQRLGLAD